jgi:hypothetical protein
MGLFSVRCNTESVLEKIKIMKRPSAYSNDLHDALIEENGPIFWKVWRSKFECKNKLLDVEGDSKANIIADLLAQFFSQGCSANNVTRDA